MSVTDQKVSTLAERVAARIDSLTATERRVARYLADHPQEVAFSSAEELGRVTGTSDASVVRTAKALGFEGLPGLKRHLQSHLATLLTPVNRLTNHLEAIGDGPEGILDATLANAIELLQGVSRKIDPAQFRKAVKLVAGARETMICGLAGLDGVADYTATHLTRIGYRARSASDSGFRLADRLLPLEAGDVVIVICHNRVARETRVILDHAKRVGARVILVTDSLGEALADQTDAVLSGPMGRPGMFSGQTSVLVLLEALTMAVAAQDRDRSVGSTAQMDQLREELNGSPMYEDTLYTRRSEKKPSPKKRS